MRNLREFFGVNIHEGQNIEIGLSMGFLHFRMDMLWSTCNPAKSVWNYTWACEVLEKIKNAGGSVLFVMYATPAYWDEARKYPIIPGWSQSQPQAIPVMLPEYTDTWIEHCLNTRTLWPWAEFNVATETTLAKTWANPDNLKESGGAGRYIDTVLRPAYLALHPYGNLIVAPGQTMRGENNGTWNDAMRESMEFVDLANDCVDNFDVHVYRNTGTDTASDMRRFLGRRYYSPSPVTGRMRLAIDDGYHQHLNKIPQDDLRWKDDRWRLYCSETGFSAQDEEKQKENYIQLLDSLQNDNDLENYKRVYAYSLWGNPASILRQDGSLTLAGEEISKRLAA